MYFFPGIVVSKSVLPRGLVRGNWHLPDMLARPTKAHHGGVKEREKLTRHRSQPMTAEYGIASFAARREARRLNVTRSDGSKSPDAA